MIVKNANTFDGKNAADVIVWHEKIFISVNIYDKAVFGVLLGELQPALVTAGDNNTVSRRAICDMANEDLYSVVFFTTKGSACFIVRASKARYLVTGQDTDNARE